MLQKFGRGHIYEQTGFSGFPSVLSSVRNLSLQQKGLCLVALPLLFELLLVGSLYYLLQKTEAEAAREAHAKQVIALTARSAKELRDGAVLLGGFNLRVDKNNSDKVEAVMKSLEVDADALIDLVKDNPQELALAQKAKAVLPQLRDVLKQVKDVDPESDSGREKLHAAKFRTQDFADDFINDWFALSEAEKKITEESPRIQARVREQFKIVLMFAVVSSVLLAILLARVFYVDASARLARVVQNTDRLLRRQPLQPPIDGHDEIAHLDKVIVDMAHTLNEAAERERLFVDMVSHDLRSPLSSIATTLANIETGMYGQLNARGTNVVGTAVANTGRLITLVNDILKIDQMESGKLELDTKRVAAKELVESAVQSIQSNAEAKRISFVVRADDDVSLDADGSKLVQVLVNLVGNAIKFSPEDSQIVVEVADSDSMIFFSVTDQGIGVSDEEKKIIFEKYHQTTGKRTTAGSGLGLALSKMIIDLHGGTIGVDSLEQGSKFWFTVPKVREPVTV